MAKTAVPKKKNQTTPEITFLQLSNWVYNTITHTFDNSLGKSYISCCLLQKSRSLSPIPKHLDALEKEPDTWIKAAGMHKDI